ncbi:MAG: hypothetical protein DRQ10_07155 [Candidatus Hydrothermota bacterium]|nr:MAG: hypothetical protein DRQ10_07155 [Candidatus Hydrothermae bacterium]
MDLKELKQRIDALAEQLQPDDKKLLLLRLKTLTSAYPFNEYEYMLMFLLDKKKLSFQEYEELRDDYVKQNKYLDLFSLAPRVFGEIWAHQHIMDLDGRFKRPTKDLDPDYEGQYDLWIEGVRVEVKSARAIDTRKRGSLASKALRFGSKEPFWMNFQQIKMDVADVFIFVGVWVDKVVYWVMSNEEVKGNKYLSHQHRGGIEYQIGITEKNIEDFEIYRVEPLEIGNKVLEKGGKK